MLLPCSAAVTTVDPSYSGVFWSQSSWILCHATTKQNLKLCMCKTAIFSTTVTRRLLMKPLCSVTHINMLIKFSCSC